MEEKDKPIWMPYKEYLLQKELFEKLEPEAINKMRYFFWNNFSDEGYEEWKIKNIDDGEKNNTK